MKGSLTKRTKIIIAVVTVIIIAAIAGGLGYHFTHKKDTNQGTQNNGSSPNGSKGAYTNPDIPINADLKIQLNSSYTRSFWGLAYTPLNVQFPWCGDTQDEVIEDLKILYQLTPRIRIYGVDCRQFEYIMNGINALNIRMGVIPTIWVDNNQTTYDRQHDTFFQVTERYGWDNIIGVSVGNEAIYRKEITAEELQRRVKEVRDRITKAGHPEIPVFSTDIEQLDKILGMSDILFDNVHPFFAGTRVEDASSWTFKYFQENDVAVAAKVGKKAVISEVGWPTGGAPDRGAIASVGNLQILLDNFVCEANKQKVPNFFFEIFDEPWKIIFNEPRETMWGVFSDKKQLKAGLTLPNCPLPAFGQGTTSLFE